MTAELNPSSRSIPSPSARLQRLVTFCLCAWGVLFLSTSEAQAKEGRAAVLAQHAPAIVRVEVVFIIRTSWLYGPGGKNFVETIIRLAKEREELRIVADQVGSPTFTVDLARAIFKLLALHTHHPSPLTTHGIYHFSNEGSCSWYEFGNEILVQLAESGVPVKVKRILPIGTDEYPLPAVRPAYSVFAKEKYSRATGAAIPDWRESLAAYFRTRED
jgi:dTDP-4-dehydrorhamnose reductase